MKKYVLIIALIFTALSVQAGLFGGKSAFLKADDAFRLVSEQQANRLLLQWEIAEGYYLYKKELLIEDSQGKIEHLDYPPAENHHDEFFGDTDVYRHALTLQVPLTQAHANSMLRVTYQGCTAGFCYPPETREISLGAVTSDVATSAQSAHSAPKRSAVAGELTEQDRLAETLFNSRYAVFGFFLLGIGLAFTPCVLPMLPLLSAIVIGGGQRPNTARALALSMTYVQGMALTYTLLGLAVAAIGLPFQIALQSPYVLIGLSIVFGLLSLSMFGLFTLQLPSAWQTRLTLLSQRQKGGAFGGVFVMGMIAGLVASPCTSAPLSGALLYVAQSGDLLTGALTLYLLALGMGLPLVLITLFGNRILPKSGEWMEKVKQGFGFVMLALPIFLLSRLLPEIWETRVWALWGVSFSLWLAMQMKGSGIGWLLRILFFISALISVKPLQDWAWGVAPHAQKSAVQNSAISQTTNFQQINSYAELQQVLRDNPKAIAMLDLYADWCVACKEFEKYTFRDPKVQTAFEQVLLLQVDMTENSRQNTELTEKLKVIGLPTIIFFNAQGEEIANSRITGFMPAEPFFNHLIKNITQ
ncbi:protein-disulfide reductase DsbD [Necropsobacter massiliensis]|uniref:protein-disulfide reductase DsbD n=1 Tax=Necropsobacter massiliensis TaxID=1400001 RepID=UPI000596347E|nr:protein-disulfide reductase DsbD [Necropsobacter massiliensis]